MFSAGNRADGSKKDSVLNAEETGEFVVNMSTWDTRHHMTDTSWIMEPDTDELEKTGLTAIDSIFVSIIKSMLGTTFISAIPPNDLFNLSFSVVSFKISFFVNPISSSWDKSFSNFFNLLIEFCIVFQFVSIPPSHL